MGVRVLLFALTAQASLAGAQTADPETSVTGSLEYELGFFDGTFAVGGRNTAQQLEGSVRVRELIVRLGWGVAVSATPPSGLPPEQPEGSEEPSPLQIGRHVYLANPWLRAGWARAAERADVEIALGATLPVARFDPQSAPDRAHFDRSEVFAYTVLGMDGGWNLWTWAPDALAITLNGAVMGRPHARITLLGEAGLALLVRVRGAGDPVVLDFLREATLDLQLPAVVAQLAFEPTLWAHRRLGLGLRTQAVWLSEGIDRFQSSLEPSVVVKLDSFALRASLMVNLDEPYGRGFESAAVWSARLGVRVPLPPR